MATRKRKKAIVDEGPFLFSEEEMIGKIENVTIIHTSEQENVDEPSEDNNKQNEVVESVSSNDTSFSDDRMVAEMTTVLRKMATMDSKKIRLIAFTTTVQGQQGLDLNATYSIPSICDTDISGYELAAWCYCSFMSAFPTMKDKLQMPYESHYETAKANLDL